MKSGSVQLGSSQVCDVAVAGEEVDPIEVPEDRALGADDLVLVVPPRAEPGRPDLVRHQDLGDHAVRHPDLDHRRRVLERQAREVVVVGVDPNGIGAGEPADRVARMGAPIEERVALARVGRPALGHVREPGAGRDAHRPQEQEPADPALVDERLGAHRHLHVAGLLGDRQLDAVRPARLDDLVAFGDIEGHRLLEIDVLAGGGCRQRQRQVGRMRGGDDNDVDVAAGERAPLSMAPASTPNSAASDGARVPRAMAVSRPSGTWVVSASP